MKVESKFFRLETVQEPEPKSLTHDNTNVYRTMIRFGFNIAPMLLVRSHLPISKGKRGILSQVEKDTMKKFVNDMRADFESLLKKIKK